MGAYLWLYPRATVLTLVPIFVFLQVFMIPAPVFLVIWFMFQFFQGALTAGQSGGVAWWAHVGGLAAGAILIVIIRPAGVLLFECMRPEDAIAIAESKSSGPWGAPR